MRFSRWKGTGLGLVLALLLPAVARAGPVLDFQFNASEADLSPVKFSQMGHNLAVTGATSPVSLSQVFPFLRGPNTVKTSANVTQQGAGLGTRTLVNGSNYDISAQTDSNPTVYFNNIFSGPYTPLASQQESLDFALSNPSDANQKYLLNTISFAGLGFNDSVRILVDGIPIFTGDIPGGNIFDTATGTVDLTALPESVRTGTVFRVETTDGNDGFFVSGLNVTAIPEPVSLAVFGLALAGGACGFRIRRKNAAV